MRPWPPPSALVCASRSRGPGLRPRSRPALARRDEGSRAGSRFHHPDNGTLPCVSSMTRRGGVGEEGGWGGAGGTGAGRGTRRGTARAADAAVRGARHTGKTTPALRRGGAGGGGRGAGGGRGDGPQAGKGGGEPGARQDVA